MIKRAFLMGFCGWRRWSIWPRPFAFLIMVLSCQFGAAPNAVLASEPKAGETGAALENESARRPFRTAVYAGKVVWLAEAMERLHGVKSDTEPDRGALVLETTDSKLLPIVEDARGRAFRVDERLRGVHVKLMVRHYETSSVIQVVRLFRVVDGVDYETDYWCEICAIAMYQLKACDCCQGPIELRQRRQTTPLSFFGKRPESVKKENAGKNSDE